MAEREVEAAKIVKQYGVSIQDAREYVEHKQYKAGSGERSKLREENITKIKSGLGKIKSGLKAAQEFKKRHVIPFKEGKDARGKTPVGTGVLSIPQKKQKKTTSTFGSNKKAKPFVQWKRIK